MTLDDYEKSHIQVYAEFAQTIAGILSVAITADGAFLPPIITHRAKTVESLRKKLQERGIPESSNIQNEIKDIAGARAVFYTESDANSHIITRLIYSNFLVEDIKGHHPVGSTDSVTDLYVGQHFLVSLNSERLAWPEYRRFQGLKCEIQIQSILNHAWATVEHDIIYKSPEMTKFGNAELKDIGDNLARIYKKYLKNAGHELDYVMHRFERLKAGKVLFDNNALDAIEDAQDNNVRVTAIETFQNSVLRYYDDIPAVFSKIIHKLIKSAQISRDIADRPIVSDFGTFTPKTFADVLNSTCELITQIRYQEITSSVLLDTLLELHSMVRSEAELKPILNLADKLSAYDIDVLNHFGYQVHENLVGFIERIPVDTRIVRLPVVAKILGNVLKPEIEGRTWNSTSISIRSGVVKASSQLKELRASASKILKQAFEHCDHADQRRLIASTLFNAMRTPYRGKYDRDIALMISMDSIDIIKFFVDHAFDIPFDERQSLEHHLLWHYRNSSRAVGDFDSDTELMESRKEAAKAALLFRDKANSDREFVLYKILVGFESVFPEAWENQDFNYEAEESYRENQVIDLLGRLDEEGEDVWFARLNIFASTKSNDLATFPVLAGFIRRVAFIKPRWVLNWIASDSFPLHRFLPGILSGLLESSESETITQIIDEWVEKGIHLDSIAHHLRNAVPFEEARLVRLLNKAIELVHLQTVAAIVSASDSQFDKSPGNLIEGVLIPAVNFMALHADTSWHRSIMGIKPKIIDALNREQSKIVLDSLVAVPRLQSTCEFIVTVITKNWPELGLEYIHNRRDFERLKEKPLNYDALPYKPPYLSVALSTVPELLFEHLRIWFVESPSFFQFDGATLLEAAFSGYTESAKQHIEAWIERDTSFAIACLHGFEGIAEVYPTARKIVEYLPQQSPILKKLDLVLDSSGTISGEYGFVELYNHRIELLRPWLEDASPKVREFADFRTDHLKKSVIAETKRVEAEIAARKLRFGEDLEGEE